MDYEKEREGKTNEEEVSEGEVSWNDALKTLGRVGRALDCIEYIDSLYPHESAEKQIAFIHLVRRFYIASIPLLKKDESEKYKKEILEMALNKKARIKSGSQTYKAIYDPSIDYRLNEILIEIQQLIRRFLMPSRRDDDGL